MKIREMMSTPAVTCRVSDCLNTAAQRMWENDCGAVPVTDDEGKLVGIVTDRDICMAAYTRGATLHSIAVSDAMASNVFSCQADDSLDAVEQLMSAHQIRRVPVVDRDNHPIGIVSLNDIARSAASSRKKNGLDRELVQTLAAIGQPRPQSTQEGSSPVSASSQQRSAAMS